MPSGHASTSSTANLAIVVSESGAPLGLSGGRTAGAADQSDSGARQRMKRIIPEMERRLQAAVESGQISHTGVGKTWREFAPLDIVLGTFAPTLRSYRHPWNIQQGIISVRSPGF